MNDTYKKEKGIVNSGRLYSISNNYNYIDNKQKTEESNFIFGVFLSLEKQEKTSICITLIDLIQIIGHP